ncbi:HAMP domain-containing methyl-accepting chemotaxis protein [soil metagenome]
MRLTIGTKIGAGYGLALVLLVIIGAVSYQSTVRLIEAAGWVSHTHNVIDQAEDVLSAVKDAETGQRGYVITGDESYLTPFSGAQKRADEAIKSLTALTADNGVQQANIRTLEPLLSDRFARLNQGIEIRKTQGLEAGSKFMGTGEGKQIMQEIRATIDNMVSIERTLLDQRATAEQARAADTKSTIVLGVLSAVVALAIVGFFLTRDISVPVGTITQAAKRIAAGDLTTTVTMEPRSDEVGELMISFNQMTEWLGQMAKVAERIAAGDLVAEIKPQSSKDVLGLSFSAMRERLRRSTRDTQEATNVLSAAASEILASTTQVAASAAETATAVAETTTTVEEVKQTSQVSSQKARLVSENAQKATQTALTGRRAVEESIAGLQRIQEQMGSIAETVVRLSEQSQAIGEIVATVSDLAEQSNLLAVNAAIEAARAGDQGRGFTVVAQEVKSLSEQSKQATTQVRTILNDIQKAISSAVMATEQGGKTVEDGVRQTQEASNAIRLLADTIESGAQAAMQISASSQQQFVGMDQVASAMENIKQASTQNVAGTKQTEAAARNLHNVGQKLKEIVGQYTV